MPRKKTSDGLSIIDRRYFNSRKSRSELEAAEVSASVARQIYQLRTEAGLTQKELAEKVGTTDSAISRIESDDYDGHSLAMLRRIAAALGRRVEVSFVRARGRSRS